jgi:hypothetical protein
LPAAAVASDRIQSRPASQGRTSSRRDSKGVLDIGHRLRAEPMACRDVRGPAMTDPEWSEIECRLRRAYRPLKAVVAGG